MRVRIQAVIGICVLSSGFLAFADAKEYRDPFWPVGYVPPVREVFIPEGAIVSEEKKSLTELERAALKKELIPVGVISGKGGRFARLSNGDLVQAGDIIKRKIGTKTFIFKVRSFTSKSLNVEQLDKEQ